MSNSSSSDDELYSWSILLNTGRLFFCDVGCDSGRFVVCVFNVDELVLEFVDGDVTTGAFLCKFKVGVETYGVTETEISAL